MFHAFYMFDQFHMVLIAFNRLIIPHVARMLSLWLLVTLGPFVWQADYELNGPGGGGTDLKSSDAIAVAALLAFPSQRQRP